jgi:hypothetical protein
VAVGDFNNDAVPDLVTAGAAYPTAVTVLLGSGDGTFRAGGTATGLYGVSQLVTGDFNRDGKLDVAAADTTSRISTLLGRGDGTFEPARTFDLGTGQTPRSLAVSDLNGDGKPDLVVKVRTLVLPRKPTLLGGTYKESAAVLLGGGNGSFRTGSTYKLSDPASAYGSSAEVAVGDFNRDGSPDVLAAYSTATTTAVTGHVALLLGRGDGRLTSPTELAQFSGFPSLAVGDINSDGKLDFVTACTPTLGGAAPPDRVSVFLGTGAGTFQASQSYAVGPQTASSHPVDVALVDVNGDGQLDIVTVITDNRDVVGEPPPNGTLSVLVNAGGDTFRPAINFDTAPDPIRLAVGDFNGDGFADVTVTATGVNSLQVFLNDGRW